MVSTTSFSVPKQNLVTFPNYVSEVLLRHEKIYSKHYMEYLRPMVLICLHANNVVNFSAKKKKQIRKPLTGNEPVWFDAK